MSTPEAIAEALPLEFFGNYLTLALSVLVFYDQLCTVPLEVEHIWGRKLTGVTLLFYLNRWAIFLYSAVNVSTFYPLDTLPSCAGILRLIWSLELLIYAVWAVFSAIRMYAVSCGSRRLSVAVFALSFVPVATNAYVKFGLTSYDVVPFPIRYLECQFNSNVPPVVDLAGVTATRVCCIAADTLILIVTWLKTYQTRRDASRIGVKMPLSTMLLRDGTIYFTFFLVLNVLDMVGDTTAILFGVFSSLLLPLQSMFISRFLLHLRRAAYRSEESVPEVTEMSFSSIHNSTVRFGSIVDNMGEQLNELSDRLDPDLDWLDDERGPAYDDASMENAEWSSQDDIESATAAVEDSSVRTL